MGDEEREYLPHSSRCFICGGENGCGGGGERDRKRARGGLGEDRLQHGGTRLRREGLREGEWEVPSDEPGGDRAGDSLSQVRPVPEIPDPVRLRKGAGMKRVSGVTGFPGGGGDTGCARRGGAPCEARD